MRLVLKFSGVPVASAERDPFTLRGGEMKFAHQLAFNTHPDWRDSYIDYDKLKRLIYVIERVVRAGAGPLVPRNPSVLA